MAYNFSSQSKANGYVHKYGENTTYKIAGVNGEQTDANNFHTAMAGLLHVVGKDNDAAAGMGRTISQDVEQTEARTMTITPTTFALSTAAFQNKTVPFTLSYPGSGQIRVTGQKPVGSTFLVASDGRQISFTGNNSQTFTAGSVEGTTTITVEAYGQYETTSATITWTASAASSFENIV